MGKIRVHELAKKLNMSNQELIVKLSAKGIVARTHSSTIDEPAVMAALSMPSAGGGASLKPRTVLRRRHKEDEEPEAVPQESFHDEPVETQGERIHEHVPESLSAEQSNDNVTIQAEVQAHTEVAPPAPAASANGSNNVVRVIDADAIRARLASEGRTFRPRPRPGAPGPGGRPAFPQVREIKVTHDAFGGGTQMVDVSGAAAKAGQKPGKKKGKDDYTEGKERKELKGGGYELWLAPGKKKRGVRKSGGKTQITQAAAHKRVIELTGPITVNELAHRMSIKTGQVVTKLMGMGMMVTVNQPIDTDTAAIVASEFEYEVKNTAFEETELLDKEASAPEQLLKRAPVVTVMGHVDHGKTSLLDALRKTHVADGEAGGITQHIGAYTVETPQGMVTFLDTPGHEAFTSMRARGAQVTDIVVLVVAADDGVMPQTIEAIDHAKAAKVPLVVAINKMDAPDAKPERVIQQLAEHGVVSEEWGGDVQMYRVSALKKQGLKELMDGLAMQAEILELKADASKRANGRVIEAKLDRGRGPIATVLTQEGTLRPGDHIVAGEFTGRVRAMFDSNGKQLESAGPSVAVQILGLSGVPTAGDRFNVLEDDKAARTIGLHRAQKNREKELFKTSRMSLENFLQSTPQDKGQALRLIVKADVYGSVEALVAALKNLSTKQVTVEIVHSGVGTITENDVNLAVASKGIVIGFNTKPDSKAQTLAAQEKVDVRNYSVIYAVLDEVQKAMAGLLAPVIEESYLGKAEVRMVFPVAKLGNIAGCYVLDGKIVRAAKVRVRRDKEIVFEGNIGSLKRFKDDVREVGVGYEFGLAVEGFTKLTEGDIIECFEQKHVAAKLDEAIRSSAYQKAPPTDGSGPAPAAA